MPELPDLTPALALSLAHVRKTLKREYADLVRVGASAADHEKSMVIRTKIYRVEDTLEDAGYDLDTGLPISGR